MKSRYSSGSENTLLRAGGPSAAATAVKPGAVRVAKDRTSSKLAFLNELHLPCNRSRGMLRPP